VKQGFRKFGQFGIAALLAGACATAALGQEEGEASSVDAFDIPDNITILGNDDLAERRATAVVNGTIITSSDVEQRVAPISLKRQIEGEMAWERLLRRNVMPFVNVSTEEVNEVYDRVVAAKGTAEYRIGEIYLSATPTTRTAVEENARRIVEQLRQGGSFIAYARQFSEASTAAVGGDLGWIRLEQLQNAQLESAAREMQPGQLAGPIEIPGGFSILYVIDKRQIGMADPRDAVVSLKQISLDFAPGTPIEEARARTQAFAEGVQKIRGCGEADSAALQIGAQIVTNDITVRSLPEGLQTTVLNLNVGQSTPPFGSFEEGVRVLMLCGRDDPETDAGPDRDSLMAQIEDDRVNKRAQRYLRDLRRDAVIEYN
jgi:peptidyl-prolyl cis-trans isomerase SurA